jgi:hypothetical protein
MNALDKLILEARAQREQDDEAHFARIQRQNGDLTLLFNEIEGSTSRAV